MEKKPLIIGLSGAKGSGKTTAFTYLNQAYGAVEVSLANKLKDVCSDVFDIPRDWFDSPDHKETPLATPAVLALDDMETILKRFFIEDPRRDSGWKKLRGTVLETPRKIAQFIGTELLRTYGGENIHCEQSLIGVKGDLLVVTDIRFPNEASYFKSLGNFVLISIVNDKAEAAAEKDSHSSEAFLQDLKKEATFVVKNNGTMRNFYESLDAVVNILIKVPNYSTNLPEVPASFASQIMSFSAACNETARNNGFALKSAVEALCLIHTEVSEAVEILRTDPSASSPKVRGITHMEEELADIIIRTLDLGFSMGLNLGRALEIKHNYNKERPWRHGKLF